MQYIHIAHVYFSFWKVNVCKIKKNNYIAIEERYNFLLLTASRILGTITKFIGKYLRISQMY